MSLARAALAAAVILGPTRAEAHAFGARYDLPLPLGFYLAAAGAAVALSFLGALISLRHADTCPVHLDLRFGVWLGRVISTMLGATGLFVLAVVLGAAFLGPQDAVRNFATVWIWVIWWVGYLLMSALIVSTWSEVDPFRRLAAGAARLLERPWAGPVKALPTWIGWLAPVGFLVIAWVELVSDHSEDPAAMGMMVTIYLAIAILGALAYGRSWFTVADPIGRVLGVFGRMAPICAAGPGVLRLRPPGEGLLEGPPSPRGEVALVASLIGVVLFDGLSETPAWAAVLNHVSQSESLRPTLLWLREEGADLMKVVRTVGLAATVATFYVSYWLLIVAMHRLVGRDRSINELGHNFSGILLPIAVAYHLSHYLSYLLIAGQLILPAASDPFGLGWDLFGTRARSIDISVIGAEQIWWIAFTALIAGHALSVIVGHRRALQVFIEPRQAAISQIPMTLAMVGLTVLSLWILSQPITE